MRVAYLEDDATTAAMVCQWLESVGHRVAWFDNGDKFVGAFAEERFLVCLVDYVVPGLSGLDVLKRLQVLLHKAMPPVIFLTGQDSEHDVVEVLRAGADDYIVKPCSRSILLARLGAVTRRSGPDLRKVEMIFGGLKINRSKREFILDGANVAMTEREKDVALFFFENLGALVTRDQLLKVVWGWSTDVTTRTVDTHVSILRKKLDLIPERGWRLSSIYGKGYRLERREKT